MLIYGHRLAHIGTETSEANCPNCGTQGGLKVPIFHRHLHLFSIPIFSIGKKNINEGSACATGMKKKTIFRLAME